MTPQDIRNLRLKNDYAEMLNIKGAVINWAAVRGSEPYIEEYEVTINLRGIIDSCPNYRNTHVVRIVIPSDYPNSPPEARLVSAPYLYHPNWYVDGRWCCGRPWPMSEGLGHFVVRMARTIQYDLEITNETSPANSDAKNWYVSKKNSGLFPCDRMQLPDPTKKKFETKPIVKKKFEIK